MIHTSLSPNAEKDDILLAVSLLAQPWKWNRDLEKVSLVEKSLGHLLGLGEERVAAVDSGRTALFTLLKALGIGSECGGSAEDEVLLQAYTCVAVPEPILWAGAKPVYADCTDEYVLDLADLEKKITPHTKAIIAQHTFGKAADMNAINALARKHKIKVIEDCAHALGGTYHGKPLGTLGDASFFSFGRDKCVSSVFGGAISCGDETLMNRVRAIIETYPLPKKSWVAQQLMHPIVLWAGKSTYQFLSLGKVIIEASKRLHIISVAVQPAELSGGKPTFAFHRFSPELAALAHNQLRKLPRLAEHRRKIASAYAARLGKSGSHISAPAFDPEHAYLRYTIRVAEPFLALSKARRMGVQLGDWYTEPLAPRGVKYAKVGYQEGSCPNAEKLARETMNLPTHIGIAPEMIDSILYCIQ